MSTRHVVFIAAVILLSNLGPAAAHDWSIFGHEQEHGSGTIVTQDREVTDFQRIELKCSANLHVTIGDKFRVSVSADDNLQDNIITEVSGRHTLIIDAEGSFSTRRGIEVDVTMPSLSLMEVDGSGDVELTGLKSEALEIEIGGSGNVDFDGEVKDLQISIRGSGNVTARDLTAEKVRIETAGSGDVDMSGETSEIDCTMAGSGDIDATRLEAGTASAEVNGSGDISVFARDAFRGSIYGSGSIDVYGEPKEIDRHVSGSGDIRRHR